MIYETTKVLAHSELYFYNLRHIFMTFGTIYIMLNWDKLLTVKPN
jgi:hypothetical protein